MTAVQVYKQKRNEQLKEDMPRHLLGALIAVGFGALAVIAGLWATHPPAGAMHASTQAVPVVPTTASVAV